MSYDNHDREGSQNGSKPPQVKIPQEDIIDFEILDEYDVKERVRGTIRHALTKTPEENREKFLVNLVNGLVGSAILHYRNKYEKKMDIKPFNKQF